MYWKVFVLVTVIIFNISGVSHANNIFDSLKTIGNIIGDVAATNSAPSQMDELLIEATKQGNTELAQRALDNGAKINCYIDHTMPLEIAIKNHNFDMANFLLHHGADPEGYIINNNDKHYYIFNCQYDMISFLLDWGVKPNIRDNYNQNLINHVIDGNNMISQEEKLNLINLLIDKGVNINNKTKAGGLPWSHLAINNSTPLMQAINDGYNDIAYTLINAGADIKLKDGQGRTALDYAIKANNTEMINKLMDLQGKT